MKWIIPVAIGIGLLMYTQSHKRFLSRGYSNNNPLNIRISNNEWRGKVPLSKNTDGEFEQFYDRKDGYRAAALNILNYDKLYRIFTLEGIINKWAPSTGENPNTGESYTNHTENYIKFVSDKTGIAPDDIVAPWNISEVVWAMAQFENAPPHPDSLEYVKEATKEFWF